MSAVSDCFYWRAAARRDMIFHMAESLEDIWADDLLDRRKDAEFLAVFLRNKIAAREKRGQQKSFVLEIDAGWGFGKTFFLERLARQLRAFGHVTVYVNAWKDDRTEDPFVAILAALDAEFAPFTKKPESAVAKTWAAVKRSGIPIAGRALAGAAKTFIKKTVGMGVEELIADDSEAPSESPSAGSAEARPGQEEGGTLESAIESGVDSASKEIDRLIDQETEKLIDRFNSETKAVEDFRRKLVMAVKAIANQSKTLPLYVLIDELDRCRPTYAVSLLERVKHLFEVENVVFIFATNSRQLSFSIQGAYGAGFDGYGYLQRFFDQTYVFEKPEKKAFIEAHLDGINLNKATTPFPDVSSHLADAARAYDLNLREIRRMIDAVEGVLAAWAEPTGVELSLLVPLVVKFIRAGTTDWTSAGEYIPANWTVSQNERDPRSFQPMISQMKLKDIFQEAANLVNSLDRATKYGSVDSTGSTKYVHNVFVPEWNGKPIRLDAASVQIKLDRLVRLAGRLT